MGITDKRSETIDYDNKFIDIIKDLSRLEVHQKVYRWGKEFIKGSTPDLDERFNLLTGLRYGEIKLLKRVWVEGNQHGISFDTLLKQAFDFGASSTVKSPMQDKAFLFLLYSKSKILAFGNNYLLCEAWKNGQRSR